MQPYLSAGFIFGCQWTLLAFCSSNRPAFPLQPVNKSEPGAHTGMSNELTCVPSIPFSGQSLSLLIYPQTRVTSNALNTSSR